MKKFISVLCAVTLVCCGLFLSCDNGNGGEPEAPAVSASTTYTWSFSDLDLSSYSFTSITDSSAISPGADGSVSKVLIGGDGSISYDSTPAGLKLILSNGETGGSYNKINPAQSGKAPGSAGAIEPSKADMVYCELAGPFTAKMIYGANSSTDKTDRTAQIVIGGEVVASGTENLVPVTPVELAYKYTGTDTVKVFFGGNNIIRIYDISIEK